MMSVKNHFTVRSAVLKGHVNKYTILGLATSIGSIIFASFLVAYQLTGTISISGILLAQTTNPAIWALDLMPFMFAYWGQSFCYSLASKAELIIEDKTREFVLKSDELELKLKHESNYDRLTNLPNGQLLAQRINQGIAQLQKKEELAVIILNIKNFKEINHQFGSFSANSLLTQFSEKLKSVLLESYMLQAYMGMNMVARLQGAEFAILIPRLRKEHHLENILKRLVEATASSYMIDGNNINISTVLGAALCPLHGDNDEMLIHHATLCLLNTEKQGKPYAIYQPHMVKNYKGRRILLKEINEAVLHEEIEVLYQPYVQLNSRKIIGTEATIRFTNPSFGVFNADKLMSISEGTVLSQHLLVFTLKQAISQLEEWHRQNYHISLTVNLNHVLDTHISEYIAQLLTEHNLSSKYLKIALTERVCLSDQTKSMAVLNQLVKMGIKIVISDFCSGYSSFIYLTNFPIHEIKIDSVFVMNMVKDEKKMLIVQGILRLADAMKLRVVADGITDETTLNNLMAFGCNYGQGVFFSENVSSEEFTELLSKA